MYKSEWDDLKDSDYDIDYKMSSDSEDSDSDKNDEHIPELQEQEQSSSIIMDTQYEWYSKLTADEVSSIFKVKLSKIGSDNRDIESRILTFWNIFLLDPQEKKTQATLADVLCLATAYEKIPPLG
ncbi:hypothetical protein CBL_10007 [Carabus blaptoides fortunei]